MGMKEASFTQRKMYFYLFNDTDTDRYRKFILRRICETRHNINPVGLLLRQTMMDSTKSQISIQKYTDITDEHTHIIQIIRHNKIEIFHELEH